MFPLEPKQQPAEPTYSKGTLGVISVSWNGTFTGEDLINSSCASLELTQDGVLHQGDLFDCFQLYFMRKFS